MLGPGGAGGQRPGRPPGQRKSRRRSLSGIQQNQWLIGQTGFREGGRPAAEVREDVGWLFCQGVPESGQTRQTPGDRDSQRNRRGAPSLARSGRDEQGRGQEAGEGRSQGRHCPPQEVRVEVGKETETEAGPSWEPVMEGCGPSQAFGGRVRSIDRS